MLSLVRRPTLSRRRFLSDFQSRSVVGRDQVTVTSILLRGGFGGERGDAQVPIDERGAGAARS